MDLSLLKLDIPNYMRRDELKEFGDVLDEIGIMIDSRLYIEVSEDIFEAVANTGNRSAVRSVGDAIGNTYDTTKKVGTAYGDITTGSGSIMKLGFDIVMRLINLIAKAIKFIFTNIPKIFKLVDTTLHKASQVPAQVLAKVRGDISLYITPNDVGSFFNQIFPKIEKFIKEAREFARGQMWGTKRDRDTGDTSKDEKGRNDLEHADQMMKMFLYLENLEFHKTIIQMNTKENIAKIFDPDYKETDYLIEGKKAKGSYFDVLKAILNQFENLEGDLKVVQEDISNKFHNAEARSQFENLDRIVQERITHVMRMTSKIVQIIGNFMRYTHKDMVLIQENLSKMLARHEAIGDQGRADDNELPTGVMPAIRRNMDEKQQNFLKDANKKIEADNHSDVKGVKDTGDTYQFYYKNYDTKKWEYVTYNKK